MQLWNKQNTSVFANSWRRSKIILIDELFKPICSKIASTTHSVTIRKRCFVKWAMLSCSSYARQFPKCNALNASFIEIKEWSIAPVDISWLKANPAQILTVGDWMLSQSRTTSSRRYTTVLGTAKTEAQKERGRDVSNKIMKELTIVSKRDPAYRDSQLKIGWTEEKCIAMDKLAQEDHSYRLS